MASKRKRSDFETSPCSSSTATFSSRDPSSSPCPDIAMLDDDDDVPFVEPVYPPEIVSPHINARTRKRFRDNRPNESTIHATTYQRLFSAARSPPCTELIAPSQDTPTSSSPPQRQSSLHSFWPISSSTPTVSEPVFTGPSLVARCEDCEAPLSTQDSDACMGGMDDEEMNGAHYACRSCSRKVCGTCAVVEVGDGRECLQCRTSVRKKWVGGIGWMH